MIKIDNGVFYMTCGEACYIARLNGSKLHHVWFGARVEPEDDLVLLSGGAQKSEFAVFAGAQKSKDSLAADVVTDEATGKNIKTSFEYILCETEEKTGIPHLPAIKGGETLKIVLADKATGLRAELYYTPYTRGGIARRAVVTNEGKRKYRFRVPCAQVGSIEDFTVIKTEGVPTLNLTAFQSKTGIYGFCTAYGGAMTAIMPSDETPFAVMLDKDIVLAPGESFYTPETLCVWSDNGRDGMARVFHDILREYAIQERGERRPVPLVTTSAKALDDVAVAAETGADAFIVKCSLSDEKLVREVIDICRKNGIKPGICPRPSSGGAKAADFARIKQLVECGAEILSLSGYEPPSGDNYEYMLELYAFMAELTNKRPELIIHGFCDLGAMCYCTAFDAPQKGSVGAVRCMPPCAFLTAISGSSGYSLKTEFDIASLGSICYTLSVSDYTPDIRRAIRAQIFYYQDYADLMACGDFYALKGDSTGAAMVSKDKSRAYIVALCGDGKTRRIYPSGLDAHDLYFVRELDKVFSGAALSHFGLPLPDGLGQNETASFHIRQVADYD